MSNEAYVLDSGPLGEIAHPKANPQVVQVVTGLLRQGVRIYIPEIADYELRRNLLLEDLRESIARLDHLQNTLPYLPLSTRILRRAAELWAQVRKKGFQTAPKDALDGDVILAAQAEQAKAIVLTENVGHLKELIPTKSWKEFLGKSP